jgi:hypothetical protein
VAVPGDVAPRTPFLSQLHPTLLFLTPINTVPSGSNVKAIRSPVFGALLTFCKEAARGQPIEARLRLDNHDRVRAQFTSGRSELCPLIIER